MRPLPRIAPHILVVLVVIALDGRYGPFIEPLATASDTAYCLPPTGLEFLGEVGASFKDLACKVQLRSYREEDCKECPGLIELQQKRNKVAPARGTYFVTEIDKKTKKKMKVERRGQIPDGIRAGFCQSRMRDYYCEVSPWRDLTGEQRLERMQKIIDKIPKNFPKEIYPCIATRETTNLEPLTLNCTSFNSTQTGFGQVTRETFLDLFRHYQQSHAQDISDDLWLAPYNCSDQELKDIFDKHFASDPVLQLQTMDRILLQKSELRAVKNAGGWKARLRKTIEFYNAHPVHKRNYADRILKCSDCLRSREGKKDPLSCLDLAAVKTDKALRDKNGQRLKFFPRGSVCKK